MSSDRMDAAHATYTAAHRDFLHTVAEHESTQEWRRDGTSCYAAWLAHHYDESVTTTRRWVADAHALAQRPALDNAYRTGDVSTEDMRAIATLSAPDTEEDGFWLELLDSPYYDSATLQREARKAKARERERADQGIYLSIEPTHEERFMDIRGRLPFDDGAVLKEVLERSIPDNAPLSSIGRLCADALMQFVTTNANGKGKPVFVVHIDADAIGRLESGGFLSPKAVERLACDALVQPVFTQNGQPVGIGRASRVVPPWLERLVRDRDKQCVGIGCPHRIWVDIHHIIPWHKGGPTDLPNLLLLCTYHHTLIHAHGWRVEGEAGPNITWIRPDGTRLCRAPP